MMCKGIYNIWFVNTVISKKLYFNKKPLPYRQRGKIVIFGGNNPNITMQIYMFFL